MNLFHTLHGLAAIKVNNVKIINFLKYAQTEKEFKKEGHFSTMEGRSFLDENVVDFFTKQPAALDIFSKVIAADWRMFGIALEFDSSVLQNLACDTSAPAPVDKARYIIMYDHNLTMRKVIHILEALKWLQYKRILESLATTNDVAPTATTVVEKSLVEKLREKLATILPEGVTVDLKGQATRFAVGKVVEYVCKSLFGAASGITNLRQVRSTSARSQRQWRYSSSRVLCK